MGKIEPRVCSQSHDHLCAVVLTDVFTYTELATIFERCDAGIHGAFCWLVRAAKNANCKPFFRFAARFFFPIANAIHVCSSKLAIYTLAFLPCA